MYSSRASKLDKNLKDAKNPLAQCIKKLTILINLCKNNTFFGDLAFVNMFLEGFLNEVLYM